MSATSTEPSSISTKRPGNARLTDLYKLTADIVTVDESVATVSIILCEKFKTLATKHGDFLLKLANDARAERKGRGPEVTDVSKAIVSHFKVRAKAVKAEALRTGVSPIGEKGGVDEIGGENSANRVAAIFAAKYSYTRVRSFVAGGDFIKFLDGACLPTNEAQIRPLTDLKIGNEERKRLWMTARNQAIGVPTPRQVRAIVREEYPREKKPKTSFEKWYAQGDELGYILRLKELGRVSARRAA